MESTTLEPNGNEEMFNPESEGDSQIPNILKPEAETAISHLHSMGDAQLPDTDAQVPAMKRRGVAETQNSTGETTQ